MANPNFVSVGLPPPYVFPEYLHPNQYITPPYLFHPVQPPPAHQSYTTTYTPYIPPTSMLISDITKGYLHHLDDKVTQLDAKIAQISMLIAEKNGVADLSNQDVDDVSEGSTQCQNYMEDKEDERSSDKLNQLIQMLKKMEKRVIKMENSDETEEESTRPDEMPLMVNHSTTPTPVSVVNNVDSLSSLEKMIDVKDEDLNQLKVSQPYASHVFDESPEKVYGSTKVHGKRLFKQALVNHRLRENTFFGGYAEYGVEYGVGDDGKDGVEGVFNSVDAIVSRYGDEGIEDSNFDTDGSELGITFSKNQKKYQSTIFESYSKQEPQLQGEFEEADDEEEEVKRNAYKSKEEWLCKTNEGLTIIVDNNKTETKNTTTTKKYPMIFSSMKESAKLNKKSTAVATIYGLDKECNNIVGEMDVCVYDPGGGTKCAVQDGSDQVSNDLGGTLHFEFYADDSSNALPASEQPIQGLWIIQLPNDKSYQVSDIELLHKLVLEYQVPSALRFFLLTRLRFARDFSSLVSRQQYTCVRLDAFMVLVQSCSNTEDLVSFFNTEPEFINELVTLLSYEDVVPEKIRILSLLCLVSLCQDRSRQLSVLIVVTSDGHRGILSSLMQKAIDSVSSSSKWSVIFAEALLSLVIDLVSSSSGCSAMREAGFIPTLLPLLKGTDPQHLHLVSTAVHYLEAFMDYNNPAAALFRDLGGFDGTISRLKVEVSYVENLINQQEALVASHCRSLMEALLHAISLGTYALGSTSQIYGYEECLLPLCLCIIIRKAKEFGGEVFSLATTVMSDLIHKDPICFSVLEAAGLPSAFLDAIMDGVLCPAEAITCIPQCLDALCPSNNGLQAVTDRDALRCFVKIFTSKLYFHVLTGDTPGFLSSGLDELMRHDSTLHVPGVEMLIENLNAIAKLGSSSEAGMRASKFLNLAVALWRCVYTIEAKKYVSYSAPSWPIMSAIDRIAVDRNFNEAVKQHCKPPMGHKEKLAKLLDTVFSWKIQAERKAEVKRIDVYDLSIVGRMSWEVIKNSFHLGEKLGSPDWTLDYVIVYVQNVEVIQILKAHKYSHVLRQGNSEMDKEFFTRKELCKHISFNRAIAYGVVFQTTISSDEANEVRELIRMNVTPLLLGIGMISVVIVLLPINTSLPTKKKQVLSPYSDGQPLIMLHVFQYVRTTIEGHNLLGMSELSGSQFVAKRIAISWYWSVTILVFDPGTLFAKMCLQVGFILEDKDDFKRGYLSRSSIEMGLS